jgi:hypothetical protein
MAERGPPSRRAAICDMPRRPPSLRASRGATGVSAMRPAERGAVAARPSVGARRRLGGRPPMRVPPLGGGRARGGQRKVAYVLCMTRPPPPGPPSAGQQPLPAAPLAPRVAGPPRSARRGSPSRRGAPALRASRVPLAPRVAGGWLHAGGWCGGGERCAPPSLRASRGGAQRRESRSAPRRGRGHICNAPAPVKRACASPPQGGGATRRADRGGGASATGPVGNANGPSAIDKWLSG